MPTFETFKASLAAETPPAGLSLALEALWWQGKGDWERAHDVAQDGHDADCSWVHAHLHRVEGDLGNAAYWYARARRPVERGPLDKEWQAISSTLLAE